MRNASSIARFGFAAVLTAGLIAAYAPPLTAAIVSGPLAALEDPVVPGPPTSARILWETDVSASVNRAYVSTSPAGPWSVFPADTGPGTRHEAPVTGLPGNSTCYAYVESDGTVSGVVQFRTGVNVLVNGSFENYHSVSEPWGFEEPDGWHGWEIFPWDPFSSGYANHITIEIDRPTGVPNPPSRHLNHRASMDRGWRTCYGGLYQEVHGLAPGGYVVSGWAAYLFSGINNPAGHRVEIIARDGAHEPGLVPSGTVIWQQNGSASETGWKYVQGTVECTTGTLTVYCNLRADTADGASFAHFDGMRVTAAAESAVGFSDFSSTYSLEGSVYDVTITYKTAVPATTQIEWGPTTAYGNLTPLEIQPATEHTVVIRGVQPSAYPYHYRALASAPPDIYEISADQIFHAPKVAISNISVYVDPSIATSCVVSWSTNYETTSNTVYFRKVGDPSYTARQCPSDPLPATFHSVEIDGLELNTLYQFHVESSSPGIVGSKSTPDRTFQTPAQAGPGLFIGFAMVGGSILDGGDDVGPGHDWERLMHYDHPFLNITGLGFASWAQCQPNDPGDGPDVYDWSAVDAAIAKAIPGKSRLGYYQMWGTSPGWVELDTPRFWQKFEKFVEEQVKYINLNYGEIDIVFENEPNISRAPAGWHWADWYIHCLSHFYAAVHRANAATGIYNKVIAGNLSGGAAGAFADLYARGLKNISDVLGIHPYPENIRDGVKVEDLALMHSIMEQYGDGAKKIWVSEGWGSGRSAGFDRSSPLVEPTALEIENMWLALAKGYDNLMTPRPNWDPSYLWGINFFCANDNWGAQGWRSRAIPQKDSSGNIIGFIVDGYWMTPDIAPTFWNGGMYDFYGNSKDALHLLFPGNGLVFMNPGFELRSDPPRDNLPHFWTPEQDPAPTANYALDDTVYRNGSRSLRLSQTSHGECGVSQLTAKRSVRPGVGYRVRVWCRTDAGGSAAGRFYVRFSNIDGTYRSQKLWAADVTNSPEWTLMEVTAVAPAFANRIEAGCYMTGIGQVWFDDVTVSMVHQPEAGVVKGYTLDEQQVPVPYSIVTTTTGGFQAVSDASGYYEMTGVPPGTYDFICRKPGYVPFRVRNQTVAACKTSFVMFCMGLPKPGLTVTDVAADRSSAQPGSPVEVSVTVRNAGQYPVNVGNVGLFFEAGDSDATGLFSVYAPPWNPRVIPAQTSATFGFTVTPREEAAGLQVSINAYAYAQEDRPNMLTNGGFDASPWNLHWSMNAESGITWSRDSTEFYSFPNSLKCTIDRTNTAGTFNWANNWSAYGSGVPIPARPNTSYTIGCYHKDSTDRNTSLLIFIQEYYFDGTRHFYNGRKFIGVPKREVWANDCLIYTTGDPNVTQGLYPTNRLVASVGPATSGQSFGVCWWDDVYLKETGNWLADDRADSGAPLSVGTECATLGDAFELPPGTAVIVIEELVVTAGAESFSGRIYAQTPERTVGVLIVPAAGEDLPATGERLTVSGTTGLVDGEKALLGARIRRSTGTP